MGKKKKQVRKEAAGKSTVPTETKAILSPWVDFWCCGGISIIVVILLFVAMGMLRIWAPESPYLNKRIEFEDILVLGFLINFPHFMASYRILYRKTSQIKEHSWASLYVPGIMIALIAYALLTPSKDPDSPEFANGAIVEIFSLTAGLLLAWHYTGQGWGMTASFSFLGGIRMEDVERHCIRSGYYALMVLHLLWTMLVAMSSPEEFVLFSSMVSPAFVRFEQLFWAWWIVVLLTIPAGAWGYWRMSRRTGISIPPRALAPWIATYFWYALISVYPGLFLVLQIFHALQYMIFPIRVEMNQHAAKASEPVNKQWLHGLIYYLVVVVIGVVVFSAPGLARYIDETAFFEVNALLLGFINIHHYVIDGAIWKIRNPAVRRDLFAHLQPKAN
ncbi:MAG: hypothetical protein AAGG44_08545 [Planctomycetota bacterium]